MNKLTPERENEDELKSLFDDTAGIPSGPMTDRMAARAAEVVTARSPLAEFWKRWEWFFALPAGAMVGAMALAFVWYGLSGVHDASLDGSLLGTVDPSWHGTAGDLEDLGDSELSALVALLDDPMGVPGEGTDSDQGLPSSLEPVHLTLPEVKDEVWLEVYGAMLSLGTRGRSGQP